LSNGIVDFEEIRKAEVNGNLNDMAFLSQKCTFCELTDEILAACEPFTCGNDDLDDFFAHDATRYARFLMGKTYCFRLSGKPSKIVCALTVSNDSIRIYDLPRSRRDHMKRLTHHEKPLRRYPGVLIGRLGVGSEFAGRGIGSETLDFIKGWFYSTENKTGCRFVIVDAVNEPKVLSFYERNGFVPLFSSEEQEYLYTGGKKGEPISLATRLLYFDLLSLRG
jgi:GNAT superfamily N-acetyltransferase